MNPKDQTTGQFVVYILDSDDDTVYAIDENFGSVTITSAPSNLIVKNVVATNQMLGETGDFTLSFYTEENLNSGITIGVMFPRQFEIFLTEGTADATCSAVYFDESSDDVTGSTSLGTTSSCGILGNMIEYSMATSDTALSGSPTNRIALTISSITNPDWGYTRTVFVDDPNTTDDDDTRVWHEYLSTAESVFDEYDFWTDRFSLFLYDEENDKTIERSTDYLNSAYLGYNWPSERTMDVNGYDPKNDDNKIEIYAGTQSDDISINLNPNFPIIVAEKLVLEASMNSNLPASGVTFTSWMYEFTYFQWTNEMEFRVAATATTSDGYYFIEWDITETRGTQYDEDQYNAPPRVLLEICQVGDSEIPDTVEGLPTTLYVGENTLPIMISYSSAPASEYVLTFTSSSELVMVIPSTITFGPDNQYGFFEIFVD